MQVILIRHGQTDWNQEDIFRGRIDVKLNSEGMREAEIIGKALSKVRIDDIYSSPLSRAYETAKCIASFHNKEVVVQKEFIDIDFGVWQGLSKSEVKERYQKAFSKWERKPERVKIPGAESLDDVRNRTLAGVHAILSEYPEGIVIIVSHGLINKVLLCAVLGLSNSHFWKVKQDNGAVNIFKYTPHGSKVFMMNNTTHLNTIEEIVDRMKFLENPLG